MIDFTLEIAGHKPFQGAMATDPQIVAGMDVYFKSDTELPGRRSGRPDSGWNSMSRTNPANPDYVRLIQAPHTFRLFGGNGQNNLPIRWQEFVEAINTPAAFKYLQRRGSGWVNINGWPNVQELTFAGRINKGKVTRVDGDKVYLRTLNLFRPPPDPGNLDPYTIAIFDVIDPAGRVFIPDPPGVPVYLPIVAEVELWAHRAKLTPA